MSDHSHYGEYADYRHDHEGDYAAERHDHDTDYADRQHRHYDLEREDESLRRELREALNEYERDLADARSRIRDLERLRPTCVVCLDAAATQQTARGPVCSDCVGEPPCVETSDGMHSGSWYEDGRCAACGLLGPEPDQEPEPEPEDYDPGPEIDDEGGMSEYRYVLPEDYQRGQS